MAPGTSFYIVYNLIYLLFIINTLLVTFHYFIYFTIQLTALFSARPERLTTFPPLGAKYLVDCVQVHVCWRLSARDLQHSPRCWFQSPTGSINLGSLNEGKLLLTTSTPSLGAPPNYFNIIIQKQSRSFLAPLLGIALKFVPANSASAYQYTSSCSSYIGCSDSITCSGSGSDSSIGSSSPSFGH